MVIRQTVPTKAPVEAETSTLIKKKVVYLMNYYYYLKNFTLNVNDSVAYCTIMAVVCYSKEKNCKLHVTSFKDVSVLGITWIDQVQNESYLSTE